MLLAKSGTRAGASHADPLPPTETQCRGSAPSLPAPALSCLQFCVPSGAPALDSPPSLGSAAPRRRLRAAPHPLRWRLPSLLVLRLLAAPREGPPPLSPLPERVALPTPTPSTALSRQRYPRLVPISRPFIPRCLPSESIATPQHSKPNRTFEAHTYYTPSQPLVRLFLLLLLPHTPLSSPSRHTVMRTHWQFQGFEYLPPSMTAARALVGRGAFKLLKNR